MKIVVSLKDCSAANSALVLPDPLQILARYIFFSLIQREVTAWHIRASIKEGVDCASARTKQNATGISLQHTVSDPGSLIFLHFFSSHTLGTTKQE
jgi:hypothetical protein